MFPTCVGMNRSGNETAYLVIDVPHMRGDEPEIKMDELYFKPHVPHMRGDEPLYLKCV